MIKIKLYHSGIGERICHKNEISTPFEYNCTRRTWMKTFMKRNKLSLKKASKIYISKKSNKPTHSLFTISIINMKPL